MSVQFHFGLQLHGHNHIVEFFDERARIFDGIFRYGAFDALPEAFLQHLGPAGQLLGHPRVRLYLLLDRANQPAYLVQFNLLAATVPDEILCLIIQTLHDDAHFFERLVRDRDDLGQVTALTQPLDQNIFICHERLVDLVIVPLEATEFDHAIEVRVFIHNLLEIAAANGVGYDARVRRHGEKASFVEAHLEEAYDGRVAELGTINVLLVDLIASVVFTLNDEQYFAAFVELLDD